MKKLSLSLVLALFVLALGAVSANAQTQITLGASSQNLVFSGQGAGTTGLNLQLGSCDAAGNCMLSGQAFGTGALSSSGDYSISAAAGNSITLSSLGSGLWAVNQSSPLSFSYTSNGSTLLTGNLELLTLSQLPGSQLGNFNSNFDANLVVTGGLLSSAFSPSGGALDITILYGSNANISTLVGTSNSLTAVISAGELRPVPEPGTVLLFGSGLTMIGGLLRRRLGL